MTNRIAVHVPAKNEIAASNETIASLHSYQGKNWAIGLNGDTFAPDGFLSFFAERALPFFYYVQNKGVSIGNQGAYERNVATLKQYISNILAAEHTAVGAVVEQLREWKSRNWAIGLNGDTLQPDNLPAFFGTRGVPFAYYVRSHGLELGSPTAYDVNIKALEQYLAGL